MSLNAIIPRGKHIKLKFLLFHILLCNFTSLLASERIDLGGTWYYRLHSAPWEIPGEGEIELPGTLDTNHRGIPVPPGNNTAQLSRKFTYTGPVSYYKTVTIPENPGKRKIELFIERTRPTTLIIDGDTIGSKTYLSSPHIYNLSDILSPGSHEIEIIVDNGDAIPLSIRKNSHSSTEYTQTNWNGMIGEIYIDIGPDDKEYLFSSSPDTGPRRLYYEGNQMMANGKPVFLRGTVDACVFPLTAHPPMDLQSWTKYFDILKEYGFNHVRFHSWCPPEAAFKAADNAGFFLQIELPVWGELDRDLSEKKNFLWNEMEGILDAYSHHHSFALFSVGNELWGDISLIKEFTERVKEVNPNILTTFSSNLYSGMYGFMEGEDFIVADRLGLDDNRTTDLRGSFSFIDTHDGGKMNSSYPGSTDNYRWATISSPVPVISHEVGQYQTYPDFDEIGKYTGVLRPDNLEEFKRRAEETGIIRKSGEFREASTKWVEKLYKAETEKLLRSKGISGFQLMALQDYPGQGTALVGLLDAFMEPKKGISAAEWKESCAPLTILAEFPRFTFKEGETVRIPLKAANYSGINNPLASVRWQTAFDSGEIITSTPVGLTDIGEITIQMPSLKIPQQYTLSLEGDDGTTKNHYDFWVYPRELSDPKDIYVTSNLNNALLWLEQGKKVLLTPDSLTVANASLPPLFTTDFWNYRMFRTLSDHVESEPSPGTLGLYINDSHPSLRLFPTGKHTDWQWYPIVANSRPLIIDRLPADVDPIIEVIDNVERHYRLSLMLECNVGKGKLIILSTNMDKASKYPEGQWLLQSIKEYMASKDFKPNLSLEPKQVINLLTKPSNSRLIRELKNETYDSHWD